MIRVFEKGQPLDLPLPEGKRVAIKPNLTWPRYKPGVTTSPEVLERVVEALVARGNRVVVVESDGGYGAWDCEAALAGHGILDIARRHGAEVWNLSKLPRTALEVRRGRHRIDLPFCRAVLESVDVFVSMPVPKVHCMTGVTLAMKNQWGLVPDPLRLNYHYLFDAAILAINRALPDARVIADGTYFLDRSGPLEGDPIRKDLVIAADSIGEFDRYLCAMMGVDPSRISHLRHAMSEGFVPRNLATVRHDEAVLKRHAYTAVLKRTPRNRMVKVFFRSKHLTRLIYTSSFGRMLHKVFYAAVGRPGTA